MSLYRVLFPEISCLLLLLVVMSKNLEEGGITSIRNVGNCLRCYMCVLGLTILPFKTKILQYSGYRVDHLLLDRESAADLLAAASRSSKKPARPLSRNDSHCIIIYILTEVRISIYESEVIIN